MRLLFSIALLAVAGTVTAAAPPPMGSNPDGALPKPLREVAVDQNLDKQIPLDLEFVNEEGETVKLSQYFGDKPVLITPVYYECPMLCSLTLNGLIKTLRVLPFKPGEEFQIVTVSIDPTETATVAFAKKSNYITELGKPEVAEGWHFLTGTDANIKPLMDAVGFRYVYDEDRGEYAHAAAIMLATPDGRMSRYFYGVEFSPKDMRLGIVEASEGKIGSAVDSMLLFCYKYDPLTGKYGVMTMRLVQIGGLITVLALGTFMAVMFRRDIRRARAAAAGTR